MCTELIDELQKLVDIYACMDQAATGDESRDEGYLEAFDIVLADLRCLIEDHKEYRMGPPTIPVGFKLHAVRH